MERNSSCLALGKSQTRYIVHAFALCKLSSSSFALLSLLAGPEVCPMKVKILSPAIQILSFHRVIAGTQKPPSNGMNDDEMLSVQMLKEHRMLSHVVLYCIVAEISGTGFLHSKKNTI